MLRKIYPSEQEVSRCRNKTESNRSIRIRSEVDALFRELVVPRTWKRNVIELLAERRATEQDGSGEALNEVESQLSKLMLNLLR